MEYLEWAFLALVVGSFVILFFKDSQRSKESVEAATPGARLREAMQSSPQMEFYVGVPAKEPNAWTRVDGLDGNVVWTRDSGAVELNDIRSFLVTYRSGEMVRGESVFEPLPSGVRSPERIISKPVPVIETDRFRDGESFVRIAFAASQVEPTNPSAYSIRVQNISNERIRILKFGKHRMVEDRVEPGPWRTGIDFREQFGLGSSHWIEPAATVTMPHEVGHGVVWVFDGETEYSRPFLAGKPIV